ncbi:MAG: hypothetical protein IKQ80_03300, partial [Clostridia bacterium]|nr:hypothetical protein [Clostridia bacterium]
GENSLPADATVTVTETEASAQVVEAPALIDADDSDPQAAGEAADAQAPVEAEAAPVEAAATAEMQAEEEQIEAAAEAVPAVGFVEGSASYDITITNANEDVISETGLVKVVLQPENLNIYDEVPSNAVVKGVSYTLIHEHEGEITELPVDVEVDDDGTVTEISFETEKFSTSTLHYTVDFEYVDPETGEKHTWSFPGTGSYKLGEVLAQLGIQAEEIASAELERIKTVGEYGDKDLYLTQDEDGEWWINSDAAFDDTYELTVAADGKTYTITVTDDWSLNGYGVTYYEQDGAAFDNTPSLNDGKYYLVLTNNYGNDIVEIVSISNSGHSSGMYLDPRPIRSNSFGYMVAKWTGESILENKADFIAKRNNWQYNQYLTCTNNKTTTEECVFGAYTYRGTFDENAGTYTIRATKLPTYTVGITYKDTDNKEIPAASVNLGADNHYYMLAKQGDQYIFYAPVNSAGGAIGQVYDASGNEVNGGMLGIDGVEFVRWSSGGTPTLNDLKNVQPKIENGGTLGEQYVLSVPKRANRSNVFAVIAKRQNLREAEISFKNTNNETVSVTPSAYYYLVGIENGDTANPICYAPVSGASGTLTFYDQSNQPIEEGEIPHVSSFVLKKFDSAQAACSAMAGNGNGAVVEGISDVLVASNEKKYVVSCTTSSTAYEFTAREMGVYQVELKFKDAAGNPANVTSGNYYVYASVRHGSGRDDTYYVYQQLNLNNQSSVTLDIPKFSSLNLPDLPYTSDLRVNVILSYGSIDIAGNKNDNQFAYGTVKSADTIGDGNARDGYSFTVTQEDGKTTYEGQASDAYTYTIEVKNNGQTARITDPAFAFDWYVLASTTKSDGAYLYASKVSDLLKSGGYIGNGSITTFYRAADRAEANPKTAIHMPGEGVSFALVRPKDTVNGDAWKYFANSANINTNAMNGSAVDRCYTLTTTEASDHNSTALVLEQAPAAEITVTAYKGADDTSGTEAVALSRNDGTYYIVGRMPVKSGTLRYDCYNVQKLTALSSGKVTIGSGFGGHYKEYDEWNNLIGSGDATEYLVGARYFEPMLLFAKGTGSENAGTVWEQLSGKTDHGLTLISYEGGASVGSYKIETASATKEAPTASINLYKLSNLKLAAQVAMTGDFSDLTDKYAVVAVLKKDGVTSYAMLKVDAATVAATSVTFTDAGGNTFHYAEGDDLTLYLAKSGSSFTTAVAAGTEQGCTLFAEKQFSGDYVATFQKSGDTITAVLTEQIVTPEAHAVEIDVVDKKTNKIIVPDPQLASKSYYLLATLTPKGEKGPIQGWKVIPVDLNDLNDDGKWQQKLEGKAFNACDYKMAGCGAIGYDSSLHDMKLRLYTSGNSSITDYAMITSPMHASDEAPSGYDYLPVADVSGNSSAAQDSIDRLDKTVVTLRQAYTKEYKIKVRVDTAGMEVSENAHYYVMVKLGHYNSSDDYTYAFAPLKMVPGVTEYDLTPDQFGSGIWCTNNGTEDSRAFTGNEKSREVSVIMVKSDPPSYGQIIVGAAAAVQPVSVGESISRYTLTGFDSDTVSDDEHQVTTITDYVDFTRDSGSISKGDIDAYLETATDFGLYTEILSVHGTDMESNIGADELAGPIGADYGFSGNNIQVNRVKVVKRFVDENGQPVAGKKVTLRLYTVERMDPLTLGDFKEITGTTDAEGIARDKNGDVLAFDKLTSGTYVLKEVVDGVEYAYDVDNGGVVDYAGNDDITIRFAEEFIVIENINVNYNYFGHIDPSASGTSNLDALLRHSRNGIIIVGNQSDYDTLKERNGGQEVGTTATVKLDTDQKFNIPADMARLRTLSQTLGDASSSQTVKIMNRTLAEVNANGPILIQGDGRYVVINVDVTGAGSIIDFDPHTSYDGNELHADFGAAGSEYSSKVMYNFITRDSNGNAHPYTGHINTTREGSGVLLAPAAVVGDLGANWGGTIICHRAEHTGSEIHSDSANKIQNINTVLTNSSGGHKTGDLELQKLLFGESPDRTTWFTFVVTINDENGDPFTGDLVASGLKDDATKVHFEGGSAEVLVRAQNKVTITGIPEGYTYTVKEKWTDETDHYQLVQVIDAEGETVEGDVKTYAPTATG